MSSSQGNGGWFPTTQNNTPGWRLDIVSLLAVIGESSMAEHAQTITASWLCLLPRLIPAPQAMLKSERPKRLPPISGIIVVGAFSGTRVDELNFAANLIHEVGNLKPLQFQEYTISYKFDRQTGRSQTKLALDKEDPERGPTKSKTINETGIHETDARLKVRMLSPLNALTLGSTLMTLGLFIASIVLEDGVAALSIACMSFASVLTGLAFWWRPKLAKRTAKVSVPPGDLVLKTRSGGFVVVHCDEEIARELYTAADEVEYVVSGRFAKVLVGFGTLFLMVAVVLLGNCNWTMQAAIGVAYLLLNGFYWMVALLPPQWSWHVAAYKVTLHETRFPNDPNEPSYTRTLWHAIHCSRDPRGTRSGKWLRISEAVPRTDAWKEWEQEVLKHVDDVNYDAVGAKDRMMAKHNPSD